MDAAALSAAVVPLVEAGWRRTVRATWATPPGMNSATVGLVLDDGRVVAKWVPAAAGDALEHGCAVAARVAAAGVRAGEPLRTADGSLTLRALDGRLALLREVTGRPLGAASDADQRRMATTLAAVHAVAPEPGGGRPFLLDVVAGQVRDVEPWVRPAVAAVLDEHRGPRPLTWGLVHSDPAPEAFLDDGTLSTGLVDWSGAGDGPLLYDVASAVMYLGGRERAGAFLAAYGPRFPGAPEELGRLDDHLRLRAAVQAAYFSLRVATEDTTGGGSAENRTGLAHARRMLAGLGVGPTGLRT